jgi:two-component system sensor histidine kinase and response regulator WspE
MVRDIGRELGKQVRFEIAGERTQIDRDILERLDAPLVHLLRNALDHGLEMPEDRIAMGKPPEGVIRLAASHHAGALQIVVSDDGRGIDAEQIRAAVIARGLAAPIPPSAERERIARIPVPARFLDEGGCDASFGPGCRAGRGAGDDPAGARAGAHLLAPGEGTQFKLELPLTLSVVRALLVDIGGEPYGFPFAHIARAVKVPLGAVQTLEGRQYALIDGQHVGLVGAHQVLGCAPSAPAQDALCVVLLGGATGLYGLVVDGFRGGAELVVRPLDPRLGKIKDIGAAALTEDGSPLLIVDVDDMIRSLENCPPPTVWGGGRDTAQQGQHRRKRVLVVDDSFTVRELQRKLLDHHGYEVEVAVDGMDGWNALRDGRFDLLISDIDMPRLDGIELVRRLRTDPRCGGCR